MTAPVDPAGGAIAYFGYGSLVNRDTWRTSPRAAHPARLAGWRRRWGVEGRGPWGRLRALSVEPDAHGAVDGLLVVDEATSLASLDAREARYDRLELRAGDVACAAPLDPSVPRYVYRASAQTRAGLAGDTPICLSYLDAVVAGYRFEFGMAGAERFFAETDGWDAPVVDDRARPYYVRAVARDTALETLVDGRLAALGCRVSLRKDD